MTEDIFLNKATQPWEKISFNIKGPFESWTKNAYFLTVVDEYSHSPFSFPCTGMSASVVVKQLSSLLSIYGLPSYIYSDRESGFMSRELRVYLVVANSCRTPYNPQGNGQCERYNDIIWKATLLHLHIKGLTLKHWEAIFLDILKSFWSLPYTATNVFPHEKFLYFHCCSVTDKAIPTWLNAPGPALLQCSVRLSKFKPLVDEVELIKANPHTMPTSGS